MQIEGSRLVLRPWQAGDEADIVAHGDNRRVWRNLTDHFPNPYRPSDAESWIRVSSSDPANAVHLAIVVDRRPVGGVGFQRLADLHSRTAEIGYWVGEAFWGRGLATESLALLTAHAFAEFDFARIQAGVLDWNPASARVLEKCGYALESRQRRNVFKDGEICDTLLFVKLR